MNVFAKEKGTSIWSFFNLLYEFNKGSYINFSWATFWFWSSSQVSARNLKFKLHKALHLINDCIQKDPPTDPILDNPDFRDPLFKTMHPIFC